MKMKSLSVIAGAVVMAAAIGMTGLSWADNATGDPIKLRREKMKGNGDAAKVIGGMLDGSAPFDAAKAAESTKTITTTGHEFSAEFAEYFTEGSFTGDTKASPDIWKNQDDFKKLAMTLETDATAANAAAATGADAFKAAAGKMFGNCKGCHEKYKLK